MIVKIKKHIKIINKTIKYKVIYLLIIIGLALPQQSENNIQKNINTKSKELNKLKNEIEKIEKELLKKQTLEKNTNQQLIDIEKQINLSERLLKLIDSEIQYLSYEIIQKDKKMSRLANSNRLLQDKIKNRFISLYKDTYKNIPFIIMLNSSNLNQIIYKMKYLNIINELDNQIAKKITLNYSEIAKEKEDLINTINKKNDLKSEKHNETRKYENKKIKKEYLLKKIETEKKKLKTNLAQKQKMMNEIEKIVEQLYKDQDAIKQRAAEIAKQRELNQTNIKGNINQFKGKLPWPVNGKIISKFGYIKNKELGTVIKNSGIDIKTSKNAAVYAIMDGVVSATAFMPLQGNIIIIDHGSGFNTVYAHIKDVKIKNNQYVQAGDLLAYSVTNSEQLSKIHFEIWRNKEVLNPEHWLKK